MVDLTLNSKGSRAHFEYKCEQGLLLNWLQISTSYNSCKHWQFVQTCYVCDNLLWMLTSNDLHKHNSKFTNCTHTNNDSWA